MQSPDATAHGGGLYALGGVAVTNSLVIDNQAYSANATSFGGGVAIENDATGDFISKYSQLSDNAAQVGGGVRASTEALIIGTTIAGNQAGFFGGGFVGNLGAPATIINSTISGNVTAGPGSQCGALGLGNGANLIANTTISANRSDGLRGGLCIGTNQSRLESTIIAGNLANGSPSDLFISLNGSVVGNDNLIFKTDGGTAPPGTLVAIDPRLRPLADNGGPTRTHALSGNSPAIDAGNNAEGAENDQRGDGFPRVLGAAADIGAYELSDAIFASRFEVFNMQ